MDAPPAGWLERVAESLCAHEERRETLANFPPRYEVLDEISRGGMGTVYRAWDPQLGRDVALKVLRTGDGDAAEAHERFQREARLAASLHHPHIVPIYDTGTWNGQDYIAMQLLEGKTLAQATPDRRTALICIRDAARALQFAHEQGIVHRDIKPSNLLLDGKGGVYVADFGVARQSVSTAGMTAPGTIVGTPAYMSPEQAQGLPVDARTDVYSLGATLYELLTGKPPYMGEPLEVVDAVRTRDPEPARRLVADLSRNVEAILAGAMERRPEDRYASAAALADDIDRYLAGERPLRRPRGFSYKIRREFVRHPWRSASTILSCLLLALAAAGLGYFIRAVVHRNMADATTDVDQKISHLRKATLLPGVDEELARLIAGKIPKPPPVPMPVVPPDPDIDRLDQSFHKHLNAGRLNDAREDLEKLDRIAQDRAKSLRPLLLKEEFTEGLDTLAGAARQGRIDEFRSVFNRYSGPQYADQREFKPKLVRVILDLALRPDLSPEEKLHWLNTAERLGDHSSALYSQRGLALFTLGRLEDARVDFERLRAGAPKAPVPPEYAKLFYALASLARERKDWSQALALVDEALKLRPGYPEAVLLRSVIRFHPPIGNPVLVLEDFAAAAEGNPGLKPGYEQIQSAARLLRDSERKPEATRAGERRRALALSEPVLARVESGQTALLLDAARIRRLLGDLDGALASARRAVDGPESFLARGQIRMVQANRDLKGLQVALDDVDKAVAADPKSGRALYLRAALRELLGAGDVHDDFRSALEQGFKGPDLFARLARTAILRPGADDVLAYASASLEQKQLQEDELLARLPQHGKESPEEALQRTRIEAYYCRGRGHYRKKENERARADFTEVLALDPEHIDSLYHRGLVAVNLTQYDDAMADFNRLITLNPKDYEAYGGRGTARWGLKDFENARKDFSTALGLAPQDWSQRQDFEKRLKNR